eukprot:SAG31_NODE_1241_length_9165_cov_4.706155_2_plen_331_part_00
MVVCAGRLEGAKLYISATPDFTNEADSNRALCGSLQPAVATATGSWNESIGCNSAVGRYLTVDNYMRNYITICELEIWGAEGTSRVAESVLNLWPVVLSKGSFGNTDVGAESFNAMFLRSATRIARRQCPSCQDGYKELYYKRLTDLDTFGPYDLLKENWVDTNNVINVNFAIYSSYQDALGGTNAWEYCNYNDAGVGFPRDCGMTGPTGRQWNSWTRGGQPHVAWSIDMSPASTTAVHSAAAMQDLVGSASRATQSSQAHGGDPGRAIDGDTNTVWGAGSCTHTSNGADQWWQVDLGQSATVSHAVVYHRSDCCTGTAAQHIHLPCLKI